MTLDNEEDLEREDEREDHEQEDENLESFADGDEGEGDGEDMSDVERRARNMGWRPEAEWDDSRAKRPPKFLTAEEYVAKVEGDIPMLRERNRYLDEQVTKMGTALTETQNKLGEMSGLIKSLHDQGKAAARRAYEQATREHQAKIDDLERQLDQAIIDADTDEARRARDEIRKIESAAPKETDFDPVPEAVGGDEAGDGADGGQQPARDPVVEQWIADNPWFNESETMKAYAIAAQKEIVAEKPGLTAEENLAAVLDEVKKRFPEKFGNPRRRAPGQVSAPGAGNGLGKEQDWNSIPAEDRNAYESLKEAFAQRGEKYTREEWMKDYFMENQQ